MMKTVKVNLGRIAFDSLAAQSASGESQVPATLVETLRFYLHDRDAGRPGWRYPKALERDDGRPVEVEMTIDEGLWSELEREAGRQGVTPFELADHAALYLAAEIDAGRMTERIITGMESDS